MEGMRVDDGAAAEATGEHTWGLTTARSRTVRQLFALANQQMRRELNDLARRLDC
jgi:hypothetical protein